MGTSMGTIINTLLAKRNIDAKDGAKSEEPVRIRALVHYAQALVSPNRRSDMLLKFVPQLAKGAVAELAFKTHPKRMTKTIGSLVRSRPALRNGISMGRQIVDIVHCIPDETVAEVVDRYPHVIISGDQGIVEQNQRWDIDHPNISFYTVPGRGHEMVLNPFKGARKAAKVIIEEALHPAA
jgi:hypothetical protein